MFKDEAPQEEVYALVDSPYKDGDEIKIDEKALHTHTYCSSTRKYRLVATQELPRRAPKYDSIPDKLGTLELNVQFLMDQFTSPSDTRVRKTHAAS